MRPKINENRPLELPVVPWTAQEAQRCTNAVQETSQDQKCSPKASKTAPKINKIDPWSFPNPQTPPPESYNLKLHPQGGGRRQWAKPLDISYLMCVYKDILIYVYVKTPI